MSLIQKILEAGSTKDQKYEILKKMKEERDIHREIFISENSNIRDVTSQIEEKLTEARKLLTAIEILEGSRRCTLKELSDEFDETHPFDDNEFNKLEREISEKELNRWQKTKDRSPRTFEDYVKEMEMSKAKKAYQEAKALQGYSTQQFPTIKL